MERRDLIRALGAATAMALVPRDAMAAWARVASGVPSVGGLTEAQLALIAAIGDTIIPRTDSPSATDVGVPAFVDVIVSENYDDPERGLFLAGLEAIDADARATGAANFVALAADSRGAAVGRIEALADQTAEPARTYWRLKGLIVHGYFTSEPVMKDVLKVQIMPGTFDGAAPMPAKVAPSGLGHPEHSHA